MSYKDENNTWVYYNGELYHAGIKGMHWGQHLPGTDWWKETTAKNMSSMPYAKSNKPGVALTRNTFGNKVRANLQTAGQAAKIYGRKINLASRIVGKQARAAVTRGAYKVAKGASNAWTNVKKGTSKLWNAAKGYSQEQIDKFKESARQAYEQSRNFVKDIMSKYQTSANSNYSKNFISGSDNLNALRNFISKEYRDACGAYTRAQRNGSFKNNLNSFIQTSQYNIASGCARFLSSIGMDDEVAKFLRKFK